MSRNLSENGLNLIKSFEGCKLTAYKCLPTEKYYTIGYGHYGSDVTAGMKITKEQAEEFLLQDCKKAIKNVTSYFSSPFHIYQIKSEFINSLFIKTR